MDDFLKNLRRTVWLTSCARYNAARRLKRRELFATVSLALLSAATIALAFFDQHCLYGDSFADLEVGYSAISVLLGLLILIFTLIEWGSENGVRAAFLHLNAERLNSLQTKIGRFIERGKHESSCGWDTLDNLSDEYSRVKDECAYNHEPIDYLYVIAEKYQDPQVQAKNMGFGRALWIKLQWWYSNLGHYLLIWALFAAALFFYINQ
jgi:hypothetical protein